jgi:hypothetical protein
VTGRTASRFSAFRAVGVVPSPRRPPLHLSAKPQPESRPARPFPPALMGCFWFLVFSGFAVAKSQVYVSASFTGNNGLFVENLAQEEVQILVDDQPRRIAFMARDELPAVYGLIFDHALLPQIAGEERATRSGTPVISSAAAAKNIAYELIDKHLKHQAVWVGTYDRELETVLDATTDGFRLKEGIQQMRGNNRSQEPFLYSALYAAIERMTARSEKRRALILFLSTLDTATAAKMKPLKNLLASANVELFILSFNTGLLTSASGRLAPPMNRGALLELGQMTSGEVFFASDYGTYLEDLARRLVNQLRTLYTFGVELESSPGALTRLVIRTTRPGVKVKSHTFVPIRQ